MRDLNEIQKCVNNGIVNEDLDKGLLKIKKFIGLLKIKNL